MLPVGSEDGATWRLLSQPVAFRPAGWRTDFSRSNVEAPAYPNPPFRGSARLFSPGLQPRLEPPLWQRARMWPVCRPIRQGTNFDWEALSGLGTG